MKKLAIIAFAFLILCASRAYGQTTVMGTFLPQTGQTPSAAGLTVLQSVNGTPVCGKLTFVAYNAGNGKPTSLLYNNKNYLPQQTIGYVRCSDGALLNPSGAAGVSVIPNVDSAPAGSLTWMQGGLTASSDGTVPATSWSEAKAIPDQSSVDWGSLPVATIVDVGYQTIESQGTAMNPRLVVNFTGGMTCSDNAALTRTDCQPTILSNPMSTLGDLMYGGVSGAPTRLAGDITGARTFLVSQGASSVATAPFLSTLIPADIPATINSNTTANAATATAFSVTPTPCAAGLYATGITNVGAANCSQVTFAQLGGSLDLSQLTGVVSSAQLPTPGPVSLGGVDSFAPIAHQFLTGINTSGGPTSAQPVFTDISGTVPDAQITSAYSGVGGCSAHQWASTLTRNAAPSCSQPSFSDLLGVATASQLPAPTASTLGGVESFAAVSHQWINSISLAGVPSATQPSFADISGVAVSAQIPVATNSAIGGTETVSPVAHEWVNSINSAGTPQLSQPSFSDVSGSVAASQLPTPTTSTLGGVEAVNSVTHEFVNAINSSGIPQLAQPGFGDISGAAVEGQLPATSVFTDQSATFSAHAYDFTSATLFAIPKGTTDPGSPVVGQVWINTGALKYRDNQIGPTTHTVEVQDNKGAANGYASLASNSLVPTVQLGTGSAGTSKVLFGNQTWAQVDYSQLTGVPTLQYQTVDNAGSALTQRATINFTGTGVTCTDNSGAGRTDCTITAGSGSSVTLQSNAVDNTSQAALNFQNSGPFTWSNPSGGNEQLAFATESANQILAGPSSGAAAFPTFRALVAADLPTPTTSTIGGVEAVTVVAHEWVNAINSSGVPQLSQPALSDLSGTLTSAQLPADVNYIDVVQTVTAAKTFNVLLTATAGITSNTLTDSGLAATECVNSGTGGLLANATGLPCGTATSVGLSLPAIFSVSGSPVTTAGTLTATLATQSANLVWAGPSSGVAAAPTFRLLVGADLPNPAASTLGGVESAAAVSHEWIDSISTSGVPHLSQPAYTDISGSLPNPSATTLGGVESIAAVSHNFLTSISTSGVPAQAQPAFSDLSGSIALAQTALTTNGDLLTVSAGALARLGITNNAILTSSSSAPAWLATNAAAGSIYYWNGSAFASLAGNSSGTNCFTETSVGIPSWGACGSGSSVNVNGSPVSSPNLNGTTPAAGGGFVNATVQVSGSNVSIEVPTTTLTFPLAANQPSNGSEVFTGNRFTDTSPTGNFFHFKNAAGTADVFKVDVNGNLTANTFVCVGTGAGCTSWTLGDNTANRGTLTLNDNGASTGPGIVHLKSTADGGTDSYIFACLKPGDICGSPTSPASDASNSFQSHTGITTSSASAFNTADSDRDGTKTLTNSGAIAGSAICPSGVAFANGWRTIYAIGAPGTGTLTFTASGGCTLSGATSVTGAGNAILLESDGVNLFGVAQSGGGGGGGGITGATFTGGLISVSGSPTLAFTVAGTSGGIPYFSSGSAWASSAALPSGDFVLGGGAGGAPAATFSIVPFSNGGLGTATNPTAHEFFGNNTGSTGAPAFGLIGASDISPNGYAVATGAANTLAVTLSPAATALTAGLEVDFLPNVANSTTNPTLNVNSLGAKTITKNGTAVLAANDLTTTAVAKVIYDGTEWQLQNPQTGSTSATAINTWMNPYAAGTQVAGQAASNATRLWGFVLDVPVTFSHLVFTVFTADTTSGSLCGAFADCYDVGIYNAGGTLLADCGAKAFNTATAVDCTVVQSSVTLQPGKYYFGLTGTAATAAITVASTSTFQFANDTAPTSGTTTSGGVLNSSITPSTDAWSGSSQHSVQFALHN